MYHIYLYPSHVGLYLGTKTQLLLLQITMTLGLYPVPGIYLGHNFCLKFYDN